MIVEDVRLHHVHKISSCFLVEFYISTICFLINGKL